jgi:hypothetical protein
MRAQTSRFGPVGAPASKAHVITRIFDKEPLPALHAYMPFGFETRPDVFDAAGILWVQFSA